MISQKSKIKNQSSQIVLHTATSSYPVSMRIGDFVLVFVTVMVISVLASIVPAQRAAETSQLMKEE